IFLTVVATHGVARRGQALWRQPIGTKARQVAGSVGRQPKRRTGARLLPFGKRRDFTRFELTHPTSPSHPFNTRRDDIRDDIIETQRWSRFRNDELKCVVASERTD